MFPFPLANPSNNSFINIGNISIWFGSKHCSGQPSDSAGGIPTGYLSSQSIYGATTPDPTRITRNFKSTSLAYFDPGDSPDSPNNKSTLDNYTTQFTLDYTNWMVYSFDFVFL